MKKREEIITIDRESVETIQKLPIFYLSLASKELFHSNFIYWLSTLNEGIETLKNIFGVNNLSKFDREKSGNQINIKGKKLTPKADLVGYNSAGKIVLVIENKVKDVPNEQQMLNLIESFGESDSIKYVILSFIKPTFPQTDPLDYISYEKVKNDLNQDIGVYKKYKYHYELISDYIRLITNLQNVITSYNLTGDYDFALNSRKGLLVILNEVKLWENYQRVAGQDFAKRVYDKIKPLKGFENIITNSSINHQKATINFCFKWKFFEIGIQIENNQFRRFIYGDINRENADRLRIKSLWFNTEWKPKRKLKKQKLEKEIEYEDEMVEYSYYGSYDMQNKRLFLYQYEPKFTKDCTKNLDEICTLVKNDLLILLKKGNRKKIESIMSDKNI
jgi:hypothetical protein